MNEQLIEDFVIVFKIIWILPVIYMIGFAFKGDKKDLAGYGRALFSAFKIFASSIVPAIFTFPMYEVEMPENMSIVFIAIGYMFKIGLWVPTIKIVIDSMDEDYKMGSGFGDSMIASLVYFVLIGFLIFIVIFTVGGYMSGEMSITALLAGIIFVITIGAIFFMIIGRKYYVAHASEVEGRLAMVVFIIVMLLLLIINMIKAFL